MNERLVERLNKRVKRRNAHFEALSPEGKRIRVAYDTLAQLDAVQFEPVIESHFVRLKFNKPVLASAELSSILGDASNIERCTGCGIGALFVAAVMNANEITVGHAGRSTSNNEDLKGPVHELNVSWTAAKRYLAAWYEPEQLETIEAAFEQGCGVNKNNPGTGFFSGLMSTGEHGWFAVQVQAHERLRLIMENIVVHKGVFKPEIKPVWHGGWNRYRTPGFEYP